jgi:prepilin-type N-terminal cleavage/methylation domain-containing protein
MKVLKQRKKAGFSLIELMIAMTITLVLLGLVSGLLTRVFSAQRRESQRAEAMASTKSALNVMSREISNSGYGLTTNGIVTADSTSRKLHFRTNVENDNADTDSPGEDVTYFYDSVSESIVRFDPNENPQTSIVLDKISELTFDYFDYSGNSSTAVQKTIPSNNTGRMRINIVARLDNIQGQTDAQTVSFTSEVTLRNSKFMLNIY